MAWRSETSKALSGGLDGTLSAIRPAGFAFSLRPETVMMQRSENIARVCSRVSRGSPKTAHRPDAPGSRAKPNGSLVPWHSGLNQE
jgi:hypothetical protein